MISIPFHPDIGVLFMSVISVFFFHISTCFVFSVIVTNPPPPPQSLFSCYLCSEPVQYVLIVIAFLVYVFNTEQYHSVFIGHAAVMTWSRLLSHALVFNLDPTYQP
jgi:hypothetical protein